MSVSKIAKRGAASFTFTARRHKRNSTRSPRERSISSATGSGVPVRMEQGLQPRKEQQMNHIS